MRLFAITIKWYNGKEYTDNEVQASCMLDAINAVLATLDLTENYAGDDVYDIAGKEIR